MPKAWAPESGIVKGLLKMGFFDLLKKRLKRPLISGGNGSSIEKAVVINTTSQLIGIAEEHSYIERMCGKRGIDYTLGMQKVLEKNDRQYDQVTIHMKNGERRTYCFDITSFYG